MLVNAQTLINMARKRLCSKAHKETMDTMMAIKDEIAWVDPDLAKFLVPECEYRGNFCHEPRSCGRCPKKKKGEP
jgi:thymidylate synthase ThyX